MLRVKETLAVSTRRGLALFALLCGLSQAGCFNFYDEPEPHPVCLFLGSCWYPGDEGGGVCREQSIAVVDEDWARAALDTFKQLCPEGQGVYSPDPCPPALSRCGCCTQLFEMERQTNCTDYTDPECVAAAQYSCDLTGGLFHLAGQAPDPPACSEDKIIGCQLDDTIAAVEPATIVSTFAGVDANSRFASSGYIDYRVPGGGVVTVSLDQRPYLRARVGVASGQNPNISAVDASSTAPLPTAAGPDTIRIEVPHSPSARPQAVTIHYESDGGESPPDKSLTLATLQDDKAALPIASTFVKGVSVVDGHLVRQFEDLRVAGRGMGLSFSRTYSSGLSEAGPLGRGWTHNYRDYLLAPGGGRYVVVEGEGSGQTFTCEWGECKPQPGHHGTLTIETDPRTQEVTKVVFRTKTGTRYEFGKIVNGPGPQRRRLERIVDPLYHVTQLEYEDDQWGGEVRRVWESDKGGRYLQFDYEVFSGFCGDKTRLTSVTLMKDGTYPGGAGRRVEDVAPVWLGYRTTRDAQSGQLESVTRGPRSEGYSYWPSSELGIASFKLRTYTDPNENDTTYMWQANRVQSISEPTGTATGFIYVELPAGTGGGVRTIVFGPRPGARAIYTVDGKGCLDRLERIAGDGKGVVTSAHYNDDLLKEWEVDPLGRRTNFYYEPNTGNLLRRTVNLESATGVELTLDGEGNAITETVETWAYDQKFSVPTCYVDPEGYVVINEIDTTSKTALDPEPETPGTGLVTKSRRYRARTEPGFECKPEISSRDLPSETEGVEVVERRYCHVNEGACPQGGIFGDVSTMIDGEGHATSITEVDAYGNPTTLQRGGVTTSRTYSDASLLLSDSDTTGRSTTRTYTPLLQLETETKNNTKTSGTTVTGLSRIIDYYPGGQVKSELSGAGSSRTFVLNSLNLVETVIESGAGQQPYESKYLYDEAGNTTTAKVRGMPETVTDYDNLDRPVKVTVGGSLSATYGYLYCLKSASSLA